MAIIKSHLVRIHGIMYPFSQGTKTGSLFDLLAGNDPKYMSKSKQKLSDDRIKLQPFFSSLTSVP